VIAVARLPASSLARWAAYIAVLVGLVLIFRALQQMFMIAAPPPLPYSTALLIVGLLEMLLSYYVFQANRASWAFLTSLNGTLFVVSLFGAPKLRDMLAVDMSLALLPALVFGTVCLLSAFAHEDF